MRTRLWNSAAVLVFGVSLTNCVVGADSDKPPRTGAIPPAEVEPIDPYLAKPVADALNEMPVMIISYIPTRDGTNVDSAIFGESNMSSPTTGDISNSARYNDDLPIYDRTYVLYNYNSTRWQAEAVHDHGHQLEAILSFVNKRLDGNTELFWNKFCGRQAGGKF